MRVVLVPGILRVQLVLESDRDGAAQGELVGELESVYELNTPRLVVHVNIGQVIAEVTVQGYVEEVPVVPAAPEHADRLKPRRKKQGIPSARRSCHGRGTGGEA